MTDSQSFEWFTLAEIELHVRVASGASCARGLDRAADASLRDRREER